VPVEADGSALFRVPAKTPLSLQPLDAEGKALQLMRSWMTAMPGETLSCGGCHEPRNATPAVKSTLALGKKPAEIRPWYGPARGFSFRGEVQPVLDRHCVGCHNGRPRDDGLAIPDLRGEQNAFVVFRAGDPKPRVIRGVRASELVDKYGGIFEPAYFTLRSFVRVPGLESDLHLLPPTEFHADTNELVQMLRKDHHGVMLDAEAWDRLITWIDLNAPCHGTWSEFVSISGDQRRRRRELRRLYGGIDEDGESPAGNARTFAQTGGADRAAGNGPADVDAGSIDRLADDSRRGEPAATRYCADRADARPWRRRIAATGPNSRRQFRHGRCRRLGRRTTARRGPDREAVLDRRL
jgi:hypothetical protein